MKKDSSVISVRVDSEIKKIIEIESVVNSITLNTLISQIITKYAKWGKYTEDIGFVNSVKPFFYSVLEDVPAEKIVTLAKSVCTPAFRDAIMYSQGEITIESILETMHYWLTSSHLPYRDISMPDGHRIIVQHELGKKWSIYFGTLMKEILSGLNYALVDVINTEQSISFHIKMNPTF